MFRNPSPAAVIAASAICASATHAQWTVTNLHPLAQGPTGAPWALSQGFAASGTQQVGTVSSGPLGQRASLWNSTAASWTNLHPAGAAFSEGLAADAGRQGGYANFGGQQGTTRASLWSGTAASRVDLHPVGAADSVVYAMSGTSQGGRARINNTSGAALWTGTAASFVNLHPAGALSSEVRAISGAVQAGFASIGGSSRAGLWSGTAASWTDLHPVGFASSSIEGSSLTQQVGFAFGNSDTRASLWSGTADSWIDLGSGVAYDAIDSMQVGVSFASAPERACVWYGSAASRVNLSDFLPAHFTRSRAQSISSDGVNYYVTGFGFNSLTNRDEALLWTAPVPTPGAAALLGLGGLFASRRRR